MIELQLFRSNFEMVLLCRVFTNELKEKGVSDEDIDRQIVTGFRHWFRSHVGIHFFLLASLYYLVRTFTQDYIKKLWLFCTDYKQFSERRQPICIIN
jgi:hypothetical protein